MAVLALSSPLQAAAWLAGRVTGQLRSDSRAVQVGDGFIAWPGHARDGRIFVPQALQAGAAACLVEAEGAAAFGLTNDSSDSSGDVATSASVATLRGLKAATGAIASTFYGQPSQRLRMLASTGTNGKTSTTWWLAQALTRLGQRCAVVGTLGAGEPGAVQSTGLTTPDPVTLHAALRGFVDAGFAACAIEASSIGIVEARLADLHIDVALFTNFTQDHLDFHGDMPAYWAAKRALFDWPGLAAVVVNVDDTQGAMLADELRAQPAALWTVALHAPARLQGHALRYDDGFLTFDVTESAERVTVRCALVGDYNASNLLVVLGGLRALGVPLAVAAAALAHLSAVPGRMQRVTLDDVAAADLPAVIVDYAHTPDALDKLLRALRSLADARGGALCCVFGCGGDRDASKRPLMGAIAARSADRVVLTSDNPRSEPPALILAQILVGADTIAEGRNVELIEDRAEAIAHAVRNARASDLIVIAGKGHEDYQETAGERRPFSDLLVAAAALRSRAGTRAGAAAKQGGAPA